jgi:hypothetical protein
MNSILASALDNPNDLAELQEKKQPEEPQEKEAETSK